MADETERERLRVIAEAHTRCADDLIAAGWQVDGMSVLLRKSHHDESDRQSPHPVGDRPLRT